MSEETSIHSQTKMLASSSFVRYILWAILGLSLLGGGVSAGYWYGIRQAKLVEEPTSAPRSPSTPEPTTSQAPTTRPSPPSAPTATQPRPITESSEPVDPTKEWPTYTDVEERFSFRYPPTWETKKIQNQSATPGEVVRVVFRDPTKERKQGDVLIGGIDMIFSVRENPDNLSPKEFVSKSIEEGSQLFKKLESEGAIRVDGRNGYKIKADHVLGDFIHIVLPLEDSVLIIRIRGDIDDSRYSDQYSKILATFKFLD